MKLLLMGILEFVIFSQLMFHIFTGCNTAYSSFCDTYIEQGKFILINKPSIKVFEDFPLIQTEISDIKTLERLWCYIIV